MSDKILISGCSYTQNAIWPDLVFPESQIKNQAFSGAGNEYISDSIVYSIDITDPPDFVYVVFSGVNRKDLAVPDSPYIQEFAKKYLFRAQIEDTVYFFSGGHRGCYDQPFIRCYQDIKDKSWPHITEFSEWINLEADIKNSCFEKNLFEYTPNSVEHLIHGAWNLNYWPNDSFLQTQTYQAVARCIDFLERHRIKYAFSFFYDVFNRDYQTVNSYGWLDPNHKLYNRIDWSKMIKPFPFDLALRHDHILEDGCHQSQDGERFYAAAIKDQLRSFL